MSWLGLSTTVLPAARAVSTFAVIWSSGKFQGVMAATTPMGSRRRIMPPQTCSYSYSRAICATARASAMGFSTCQGITIFLGAPSSAVMVSAISCWWASR